MPFQQSRAGAVLALGIEEQVFGIADDGDFVAPSTDSNLGERRGVGAGRGEDCEVEVGMGCDAGDAIDASVFRAGTDQREGVRSSSVANAVRCGEPQAGSQKRESGPLVEPAAAVTDADEDRDVVERICGRLLDHGDLPPVWRMAGRSGFSAACAAGRRRLQEPDGRVRALNRRRVTMRKRLYIIEG